MQIDIAMPIFKCADDERIFFGRLRALALSVRRSGNDHQRLTLTPLAQDQFYLPMLRELCAYWGIEILSITQSKSADTDQ